MVLAVFAIHRRFKRRREESNRAVVAADGDGDDLITPRFDAASVCVYPRAGIPDYAYPDVVFNNFDSSSDQGDVFIDSNEASVLYLRDPHLISQVPL